MDSLSRVSFTTLTLQYVINILQFPLYNCIILYGVPNTYCTDFQIGRKPSLGILFFFLISYTIAATARRYNIGKPVCTSNIQVAYLCGYVYITYNDILYTIARWART